MIEIAQEGSTLPMHMLVEDRERLTLVRGSGIEERIAPPKRSVF
jgi:hypothetical protein